MVHENYTVKEITINESKVYFNKTTDDCLVYRVLELNLSSEKMQCRVFGIQIDENRNGVSTAEKIENFSSTLSEAVEFVNVLIKQEVRPKGLFDYALAYLALKIDHLADEKFSVIKDPFKTPAESAPAVPSVQKPIQKTTSKTKRQPVFSHKPFIVKTTPRVKNLQNVLYGE